MENSENLMEKIVSLAKRRGFIFPGSEVYGGLAGTWDYGPLGVALKNNIKDSWRKKFISSRRDMYEVDAAILMNSKVWEASGHISNFTDPLVECKICHMRLRSDKPGQIAEHEKTHKQKVEWTEPKNFNLLFVPFFQIQNGTKRIVPLLSLGRNENKFSFRSSLGKVNWDN